MVGKLYDTQDATIPDFGNLKQRIKNNYGVNIWKIVKTICEYERQGRKRIIRGTRVNINTSGSHMERWCKNINCSYPKEIKSNKCSIKLGIRHEQKSLWVLHCQSVGRWHMALLFKKNKYKRESVTAKKKKKKEECLLTSCIYTYTHTAKSTEQSKEETILLSI